MNYLAESALWHLWPKLIKRGRYPPDGGADQVQTATRSRYRPRRKRPPIDGFARAFRLLLGDPGEVTGLGEQHECDQVPQAIVRSG